MMNAVPGGSGTSATTGVSIFSAGGALSVGKRSSSQEASSGTHSSLRRWYIDGASLPSRDRSL